MTGVQTCALPIWEKSYEKEGHGEVEGEKNERVRAFRGRRRARGGGGGGRGGPAVQAHKGLTGTKPQPAVKLTPSLLPQWSCSLFPPRAPTQTPLPSPARTYSQLDGAVWTPLSSPPASLTPSQTTDVLVSQGTSPTSQRQGQNKEESFFPELPLSLSLSLSFSLPLYFCLSQIGRASCRERVSSPV